jgi:hypothetical protein
MSELGQPSRSKKCLVYAMAGVAIASFILWFVLFCYLLANSPSTPVPATGQIYKIPDHGYYFYVSKTQSRLQDILPTGSVFLFFGAILLGKYWNVIHKPDNMLKKSY